MTGAAFEPAAIRARADWLQRRLALIPAPSGPAEEGPVERAQRVQKRHREGAILLSAMAQLDPPGGVTAQGDLVTLVMMGVQADSADGLTGACEAWIAKAGAA